MKHYLIIILLILTSCPILAQGEEWVRHVAGENGVRILSVDKSSTNNIYATGMYIEDACIDDDEQNYYCISDDNSAFNTSDKGFVVAMSPKGQRLWTVFLPSYFTSNWFYFDIAIDENDHIYIASVFSDTSEVILPDGSSFEVQSSGNRDAYIMKLDTLGNLIWFKQFNGDFTNIKMTLNNVGNVIIGGTSFPVDLNPDGNEFMTDGGLYIAEYDDNGDFIWGYSVSGQFQFKDITSDIDNNILITGEFRDTVNFNPYGAPQIYTTGVSRDAFILKINSQGNFEWVNRTIQLKRNDILQPSMYPQVESNSLTTDSVGNIYCVGSIYDTAVFSPDDSSFYYGTYSTTNGYVLKLDDKGKYKWIYKIEIKDFSTGYEDALVYSISTIKNNLLVSGLYSGKMQLNESSVLKEPEYVGNFNSFILKIDENKTFKWFKEYKGKTENSHMIYCAKIINLDNIYIVTIGDLLSQNNDSSYEFFFINEESSQISPWESDSFSLFSSFDGFIHKFQDPDYEITPEPEFNLNIYPNPTTDIVKIYFGTFVENISIKIFDLCGKIVYDNFFLEETVDINIDLKHLSSSTYIIKIQISNKIYNVKLIKQN